MLEFVRRSRRTSSAAARRVDSIRWILENGSGADRQLRVFNENGGDLKGVVDFICEETSRGVEVPKTASAISH